MSVKLADPHTLKVTYKDDDGKVRRENTFVLGEDGTTITETDVNPAPVTLNNVGGSFTRFRGRFRSDDRPLVITS